MKKRDYIYIFQIDKLRTQAEEQGATSIAQEEEVHGKQRELDSLKAEETQLLEDIKQSEKEISRLEYDLNIAQELVAEVSWLVLLYRKYSRNVKYL